MENVYFGNINKTPEATEKSDWDWNTAWVQLMEARTTSEIPTSAHEHIMLRGGMAISESANRACAGCVHYYESLSYRESCIGCIRKYM